MLALHHRKSRNRKNTKPRNPKAQKILNFCLGRLARLCRLPRVPVFCRSCTLPEGFTLPLISNGRRHTHRTRVSYLQRCHFRTWYRIAWRRFVSTRVVRTNRLPCRSLTRLSLNLTLIGLRTRWIRAPTATIGTGMRKVTTTARLVATPIRSLRQIVRSATLTITCIGLLFPFGRRPLEIVTLLSAFRLFAVLRRAWLGWTTTCKVLRWNVPRPRKIGTQGLPNVNTTRQRKVGRQR